MMTKKDFIELADTLRPATLNMENQVTKETLAQINRRIERAYYLNCKGTSISILDIPKLFKEAREAVMVAQGPLDLEVIVCNLIQKYNANKGGI